MTPSPDDLKWLSESKMLELCRLPRSVLNSWKRAGIELWAENGAYGLSQTIAVLLLGAAREHIRPKQMAGAWRELVESGEDLEILHKARGLKKNGRFDLVVDPRYGSLTVVTNDRELAEAVRHPSWPRPVVVVDVAGGVYEVVRAFDKVGNATARPKERGAGRPRSTGADVYEIGRSGR